jgi:cephalosporin-C deacetylase-like acetyl esterase
VKARNEHYAEFKARFSESLDSIMSKYDEERKEESRFTQYWNENLKEITTKHI